MSFQIINIIFSSTDHPLLGEDVDMNLGVPTSRLKAAAPDSYANILLNGHSETAIKENNNMLPRRSKRHQIKVPSPQQQIITDCKDDTKSFCEYHC
jgi:hypothetical protein